jgi:hypothetical protein
MNVFLVEREDDLVVATPLKFAAPLQACLWSGKGASIVVGPHSKARQVNKLPQRERVRSRDSEMLTASRVLRPIQRATSETRSRRKRQ